MQEVKNTSYISSNDISFDNKEDCLRYEKFLEVYLLEIKIKINKFLSKNKNYWNNVKEDLVVHSINIEKNFHINIILTNPQGYEPYEDFNVDMDRYNKKIAKLSAKYHYTLSVPHNYWGK